MAIQPGNGEKKVVVVGGGVAGLEAARVAAVRGYEVDLYEKSDVLGGQITIRIGDKTHKCKKGESFYFKPHAPHCLENHGKIVARVLWVSSPPSF